MKTDNDEKPGMYPGDWAYVKTMGLYLGLAIFVFSVLLFVFGVLGPAFCRQLERFI